MSSLYHVSTCSLTKCFYLLTQELYRFGSYVTNLIGALISLILLFIISVTDEYPSPDANTVEYQLNYGTQLHVQYSSTWGDES